MTEGALRKRVAYWQKRMNLDHWTLNVEAVEVCDGVPGSLAAVRPSPYYDYARVQITHEAMAQEKRDLDITICHELCHIMFRDLDQAVHSVCGDLASAVEEMFHDRVEHATEGAVDRFARIIVDLDRTAKR